MLIDRTIFMIFFIWIICSQSPLYADFFDNFDAFGTSTPEEQFSILSGDIDTYSGAYEPATEENETDEDNKIKKLSIKDLLRNGENANQQCSNT